MKEKLLDLIYSLSRYEMGQGESIHSGIEMRRYDNGRFLYRDDVIKMINELNL